MEKLKGFISEIIYKNPENGYLVAGFLVDEEEETIVGLMPDVDDGEMLEVTGEWTVHKIYDRQFKVSSYVPVEPEDTQSMIRYLGSGFIKGVGPTMAKRIVDAFGTDSFEVIEKTPEKLAKIKGISLRKAQEIGIIVHEKRGLRQALMFLQKYGIGNNLALKVYSFYGDRIYRILEENPYKLAEDIPGIGFKIADEIAEKTGIRKDSDFRISSGILYVLSLASGQGNMYLPRDILLSKTKEIIGVKEENIGPVLDNLSFERKVILSKPRAGETEPAVYAPLNFYTERSAANILRLLAEDNVSVSESMEKELLPKIIKIASANDIDLDEFQKKAVLSSAVNQLSVITGGPGTGKTTIINILIRFFDEEGLDIALGAPTGRAAKRMTEATGYEAKTLHRLLELNGAVEDGDLRASFSRNEENPIEADVVIVDEMSMVDAFLFLSLLKAVGPGTKLIMVGDVNQLPSVGPGQVLKDLIDSECFPVTKLKKIFRQKDSGDIVVNAHRINNGESIICDNKSKDFFLLKRDDALRIEANAVELITSMLPGYVGVKPLDIQVITPTRKGILGVEALNRYFQDKLNPKAGNKKEVLYKETIFREGDKVMQIKNNYKAEWEILGKNNIPIDSGLGIFNGDTGRIKKITEITSTLRVVFDDGREIDYNIRDLDELEHAYAITVHKSQGSEYAAVVMPLLKGPKQLMNRNLLYTAVTRAKKCLVILGEESVIQEMIDNNKENLRFSGLKERIIESFGE